MHEGTVINEAQKETCTSDMSPRGSADSVRSQNAQVIIKFALASRNLPGSPLDGFCSVDPPGAGRTRRRHEASLGLTVGAAAENEPHIPPSVRRPAVVRQESIRQSRTGDHY